MTSEKCAICGGTMECIYDSPGPHAVTSLSQVVNGTTAVFLCNACSQLQTSSAGNEDEYYDTEYNIFADVEDEDHIYAVIDGEKIFRTQHQGRVAVAKQDLPKGAKVLEYGSGKGLSLRRMLEVRPDLAVHAFDVSKNYVDHWDKFIPKAQQAVYDLPPAWQGQMDSVVSFFALEHVKDPMGFMKNVCGLLKPGGRAHIVMPNAYRNPGDFLVVDHVNHFSPVSLDLLFRKAGFENIVIDDQAHEFAYVVSATRPEKVTGEAALPAARDVKIWSDKAREMARYWTALADRIRATGPTLGTRRAAIFGSGFYAMFIASTLPDLKNVECFLDQNPFQHTRTVFDKPIRTPDNLDPAIGYVYVGLNPNRAKDIIGRIPGLDAGSREFFIL